MVEPVSSVYPYEKHQAYFTNYLHFIRITVRFDLSSLHHTTLCETSSRLLRQASADSVPVNVTVVLSCHILIYLFMPIFSKMMRTLFFANLPYVIHFPEIEHY